MEDKTTLIDKLQSVRQCDLLRRNYESIVSRMDENGFFPESLTGTYSGMFSRTVGALGRLFTLTGELDLLEKCVSCCQRAMLDANLAHVPHVLKLEPSSGKAKILCDLCQIDGQLHLVLAWALLALARERNTFEDDTYPFFSNLMSLSTSGGFLHEGPSAAGRIEPGLVLNTHLEHSREFSMWIAYDFLSNSFAAAALEKMIKVADRRHDAPSAALWRERLEALTANIRKHMIFERGGKRLYREMLLPTGRAPKPFSGLSWLNLAPIASGWEGYDEEIFVNTIEFLHEHATIHWDGPRITACELNFDEELGQTNWCGPDYLECEWSPEGHCNNTFGKILGWDLLYCVRHGAHKRAYGILDFLDVVNELDLYSESFTYKPSQRKWILRDGGNGEQVAWLCWAMFEARATLGI